ncbi:MAG TPA: FxLYD domain-containing protein [Nitrososphaeraceae archaeon]
MHIISAQAQEQTSPEDNLRKAQEHIEIQIPQQIEEPSGAVSIISNSSYTDSSGNLHIDGEVYNEMALKTAMDVQVIATFYDTTGKVVRTTRAFTDPKDLPSGENATFDVPLYSAKIPQANRYELAVAWR